VLLSISEACRILHINPQTLRRWENAGKLKCAWTEGGQRRVALEEVARVLGCDPEDVEVEPQEKGSIDLRKKRMEVEAMRLDLRKEKAARALSRVKGDSVRKARDELEILRIEKEKERLLADEREAEAEREYAKHRERLADAWVQFSYKCLDIVSYIAPSLVKEPEHFPLELKVKVKKAIMEFLGDLEIDKDIDAVKLQVEKIAHRARADFYKPKWKSDMVEYVLSWLSKTWPFWLDKRAARMLEGAFRQTLEQRLTGLEEYEDVDKEVERLRDEALSEISKARAEERQRF
jgi:hypothetical protein